MFAGLSPASIPDLGATVAKIWWTMYRFMLAGLSFSIISDLGPAVAQDWPANLRIYIDRPMCRSMLACLSSACIPDPGQPNHGPR